MRTAVEPKRGSRKVMRGLLGDLFDSNRPQPVIANFAGRLVSPFITARGECKNLLHLFVLYDQKRLAPVVRVLRDLF